ALGTGKTNFSPGRRHTEILVRPPDPRRSFPPQHLTDVHRRPDPCGAPPRPGRRCFHDARFFPATPPAAPACPAAAAGGVAGRCSPPPGPTRTRGLPRWKGPATSADG